MDEAQVKSRIANEVSSLEPISTICRHSFISQALEIEDLGAKDAGALGFMAKMLVQATLPHGAQSGRAYVRTDGDLTLSIVDLTGVGLPYGSYPRLLLIWVTTEAVRTKCRHLELGRSLSSFMAQLGLSPTGGRWGTIPRLRDQMQRLFGAAISTRWSRETAGAAHEEISNLVVAEEFDLWWNPQRIGRAFDWKSKVSLSQKFFEQTTQSPVPLDLRAIKALKKSPLALDLYAWTTRRVSYLRRPVLVPWRALQFSFGAGYADTPQGRFRFRESAIDALRRVVLVYPKLRVEEVDRGLLIKPSATHVARVADPS
jgi:hypothetical protein